MKQNIYEQISKEINCTLLDSKFKFPICKSASEFQKGFSKKYFDVPVGLIIDEFDILMNHKEFISCLHVMKHNSTTHQIKILIVIGVFELTHLGTFRKENNIQSPFSNDNIECAIPFSNEEEYELFSKFIKQESIEIENGVLEEIHHFTNGIPGYFCLCGYALKYYISKNKEKKITNLIWNRLKTDGTINNLVMAHQSLKDSYLILKIDSKEYSKARDDFEILLRNGNQEFKFDINNPSCNIFSNLGFISPIHLEQQIFQIGPPIMIECLGYLVLNRSLYPKEYIPYKSNELDVFNMLKMILPYFDKQKMKNSILDSYKETKVKDYRNSNIGYNVPKKTNYLIEIVSILRLWLPYSFTITTETNCVKKFAYINIKYPTHEIIEEKEIINYHRVALEIISNERYQNTDNKQEIKENSVIGNILRTEKYGKELNSEVWVIHFVTVINFPNFKDIKWYQSK